MSREQTKGEIRAHLEEAQRLTSGNPYLEAHSTMWQASQAESLLAIAKLLAYMVGLDKDE